MNRQLGVALVAAALVMCTSACAPEVDTPAPDPGTQPAVVQLELSWKGLDVTRLHFDLQPQGLEAGHVTSIDVGEAQLSGDEFSITLNVLPGTWRLDAVAYSGDERVAAGSTVFDVVSGQVVPVRLTLKPWGGRGDTELSQVQVVVRMCPESPIEAVITHQEWIEPEPDARARLHLVIAATVVDGLNPAGVVAEVRWGEGELRRAEVALQQRAEDPLVWDGQLEIVDAEAEHSVQVSVDGLTVCVNDEEPEGGGEGEGEIGPLVDPIREVFAGRGRHACVLRFSGKAECWGECAYGECNPPEGARFTTLVLDWGISTGLTEDGEVLVWGDPLDSPIEAPAGEYSDIAAIGTVGCGVRAEDGRVACWGSHDLVGLPGLPQPAYPGLAGPGWGPQISVSGVEVIRHYWGQTQLWGCVAGSVPAGLYCFGEGLPDSPAGVDPDAGPHVPLPDEMPAAVQFASWGYHGCWLTTEGRIGCFGWGPVAAAAPDGDDYVQVVAGEGYSCGLREGNRFHCWGLDVTNSGILDPGFDGAIQLSAGTHFACALRPDRSVLCWGQDTAGEILAEPKR